MQVDTAGQIINDAAIELGLIQAEITDPFASPDPNIALLGRLMTKVGRKLLKLHDWPQFIAFDGQINTANGTNAYVVDDLRTVARFRSDTFWNTTTGRQLFPMSDREYYAYLAGQFLVGSITQRFYIQDSQILIVPTPTASEVINFNVVRNLWVGTSAVGVGLYGRISSKDHYPIYDAELFTSALRLEFLRAKGMDSAAAQDDFQEALEDAKNQSVAGSVVAFAATPYATPGTSDDIAEPSVPETGFGS